MSVAAALRPLVLWNDETNQSASISLAAVLPGLQALLVLPGGDLLVGDVGGSVRAYRQLQDLTEDGRPACPGPPRAHGTVKYTHPKDPTRPLLVQVSADTFTVPLVVRYCLSGIKLPCISTKT